MSNLYGQNFKSSPARAHSSTHIWANTDGGSSYLESLLEEKEKVAFYVHDIPICNKLLNEEILKISEMIPNQGYNDFERLQLGSPNRLNHNLGHWDRNSPLQHQTTLQGPPIGHGQSSLLTKKLVRLDVPVDRFPGFNFVGRLLGPRGNSLKRIEALTGCRLFIRGRGSMKDPNKEERLRGRPGHGHLNEPLHILIEAESPENVVDGTLKQAQEIIQELLKPVNYSRDLYKRQQLRELATLKSLFGEDNSQPSSSKFPCGCGAMKCTTTARKGAM
ncbi:unnamed protein product [Lactuca virosa]|uniref:K Homology domain-containing protein n=1 Tax=Lactuca virosa TaxID=75947 RepID=A0AAU9M021_9ASTR|nr:unnamed protein product [Lactuca virosa]